MRGNRSKVGFVLPALFFVLLGCAPAGTYDVRPTKKSDDKPTPEQPTPPPPSDFAWMNPDAERINKDVVEIRFINEQANPEEWAKLASFWTVEKELRPQQPAALLGLPPLLIAPVAAATQPGRIVKVRMPSGIDPIGPEQLPGYNPPTLGKWALGKLLFYRNDWLTADEAGHGSSCAACHRPERNFTDGRSEPPGMRINTPTLLNVVYNRTSFWDGRASSLEEVVQRLVEDDRAPASGSKSHVWGGAVRRLRANAEYVRRFREVFGTPPTQDALGKALATYMRTILSGDSLHDRAVRAQRERKGKELTSADYEKVMDEAALKRVLLEPPEMGNLPKKEDVAKQLHLGYTLFHGKGQCSACHSGSNYTDNRFHNLGIDVDSTVLPEPGREPGRFGALPPGQKDWNLVGAYKTPTLRGLLLTRPYFHDGFRFDLFDTVSKHVKGDTVSNPYRDPLLRDPANPLHQRDLKLKEEEVRALTMFLNALDGEPVDAVIADPTRWPEGTEPPKE